MAQAVCHIATFRTDTIDITKRKSVVIAVIKAAKDIIIITINNAGEKTVTAQKDFNDKINTYETSMTNV
ncbi:MAG: hypothetical protein LBQ31_08795 [Bacteroidales bacterium]|nr:hypothetical protein [Bacteroidales bacterium]